MPVKTFLKPWFAKGAVARNVSIIEHPNNLSLNFNLVHPERPHFQTFPGALLAFGKGKGIVARFRPAGVNEYHVSISGTPGTHEKILTAAREFLQNYEGKNVKKVQKR